MKMDSSSLSAAVSLSSPSSFCTAVAASSTGPDDETALSSPGEPVLATYSTARQLPKEIREHVRIWLEEKMYPPALDLLHSLLSPGRSRSGSLLFSAWVPPPNQLALLSTLAIHPIHTNRPSEREDALVSIQAIRYLASLLAVVGPINANLRSAFLFTQSPRGGRRSYGTEPDFSDAESSADEALGTRLARDTSIWARGHDFWKVVGWAFHCSALHPQRWRHWKPWLEFMIDVLEKDFDEREGRDKEASGRATSPSDGDGDDDDCSFLRQSLIMAYLDKYNSRTSLRQIVKALLADGGPTSSLLFHEVFDRETKSGPKGGSKRKRDDSVLDLNNNQFGDYFDDDSPPSSQGSDGSPVAKTRVKARKAAKQVGPETMSEGFVESVPLRLRLFFQVARAAYHPSIAFLPLGDVYNEFANGLRGLPVPAFALFVNSAASPLIAVSQCSLLKNILRHYLPSSIPDPQDVDPLTNASDGVSIAMLTKCYLPFAANNVTVETNAKMSLVLENLFGLVWKTGGIAWGQDLQSAVEKGVKARNDRTKPRKADRPKPDADTDAARVILARSGQRLVTMMSVIKFDDEEGIDW